MEERSTRWSVTTPPTGARASTPRSSSDLRPRDPRLLHPVVWRCPTTRLVEGYRQHVRPLHLDVGPGTGYFLERAGLPDGSPVTLLDPNTNVLDHAPGGCSAWTSRPSRPTSASRCPSRTVRLRRAQRRDPLPPRTAHPQGRGVANVAAVLAPDGRPLRCIDPRDLRATHPVGAEPARRQQPAGRLRQPRRHRGGASRVLEASFERVELETVGSFAIFAATHPRTSSSIVTTP